jgi:hypothetical protein
MSSLFAKLNLKSQPQILVVAAPPSFEPELDALQDVKIVRDPAALASIKFALVFVTRQSDLDTLSQEAAKHSTGDPILWFAYPKASSRRYACDFNRDSGWDVLRGLGFDSVRQVAIDEDWSALRFRRVQYIGGGRKRA